MVRMLLKIGAHRVSAFEPKQRSNKGRYNEAAVYIA